MNVVLSLYPNSRGMGYACVDIPQTLLDYGIMTIRPWSTEQLLRRISKLLDYYQPAIVVLRQCNIRNNNPTRVALLIDKVAEMAKERGLPVYAYRREQIKEVLEQFGARSKYEISRKLIEWFPELESRAPKLRKLWMDEDYNMGIFDSLALAITYHYLET